mgnify:CR=1 FL=1
MLFRSYDAWGNELPTGLRPAAASRSSPDDATAPGALIDAVALAVALNPYRYTGERWDLDLHLYHLRARDYAPTLGRFLTADTYEGTSAEPKSLHPQVYAHDDPVNNTDPSGEETIIGISIASSIGAELHGQYDTGVTTIGNSLKNTLFGVVSDASVGQVIALNTLDNAGGLFAGRLIGKLAQLRKLPGVVKGVGKAIQPGRWLRGSQGNAAFIPEKIAAQLTGRKFANFDEFRDAFWKLVGDDRELAKYFSTANLSRMKGGLAPVAPASQQVGARISYELHHSTPIQHGGDLYDLDNLIVVTPRYHQEILEPAFHY